MRWIERHLVKEALAELADASFQERVWLGGSTTEVGSISEAASQLFDDSGLGDALEQAGEAPVFNRKIDETLTKLDQVVWPVARSSSSPSDILAGKRIATIRSLSAEALFRIIRLEAAQSRTGDI